MGTLLSIYLESCAGPNVMMQQVTQRMDDAGQDPCGAHRWAPEAAKLLTVVAPPAGSLPLPRRGRGPLSVPRDRGTHFYFIAIALDEVLMHCGRDTTVGMNPVPPKQHCVCTLAINDEERCWYSLAAYYQLHIKNPHRL